MTQSNPSETVAQRIAEILRRHEVEAIFGQSLPSAVILAAEAIGIRQIAYRQENMGGAMADGYARVSGKVGVVAAQNGPAATLLVPPLAEALKASIPIVALVQDVERDQTERNAFQDFDQIALFQPCTKWVRRVTVPERIDDYMDAAFTAATSGRCGPVALLLPADLLRAQVQTSTNPRKKSLGTWPLDRIRPSDASIRQVASLIVAARSPVVIAGGGVHCGGAAGELAALQQEASLPVFTTNMGKGSVDEFHPLSAGVLGSLTGPRSLGQHSLALVDEADLVVLVGSRTNQNGTDNWRQIPPGATVVHIDIDPVEVGRNYEAVRLIGDASETLAALREELGHVDLSRRDADRARVEARIASFWRRFDEDRYPVRTSASRPIRPERIMNELQQLLTGDAIVVADASYSSLWILGQLRTPRNGTRFVAPRGLAGLGWGLPLALGAKVARPEKPVIVVVGDGGFAHSWAELETMVRMKLPITILVLNNGILGFQRDAETVKFGRYTSACHFADVDHTAIAEACGCPAVRIEDPDELANHLARGIRGQGPLLIEVITDPEAHPPLSFVTGGTSGIGLATVRHLLGCGYRVATFGQNANNVEACVRQLWADFGIERLFARTVDIAVPEHVKSFFQELESCWGQPQILVCNAGISPRGEGGPTPFSEITLEEWNFVLSVNLTGVMLCCQTVLPGMARQGFGRVLLVGSVAGRASPKVAGTAYVTSKAALAGLARSLVAQYAGLGVTVNTVAPGRIATAMSGPRDSLINEAAIARIPAGRMGEPEEVAVAIGFLTSDQAGFINGAILDINGGEYAPL
jgi:acetolactate synthase-1/2/3 large subunit